MSSASNYSAYENLNPEAFSPQNCSNIREFSRFFLPSLYSIVFIVGFIGNGLVVCVLVKYHKTSNMSDLCLFNLAISDLFFLISLPFWAYYAAIQTWTFGNIMCCAVIALYFLGFYGSIFFMILMTVDRYTVIVHTFTFLFAKHRSVKSRIALALFIWTLSLGASLPHIIFSKTTNTSDGLTCYAEYPQETAWKSFLYMELNILGWLIPLSVMVFCYSHIFPILMAMKSQKKHKAVRTMLVLIIVFFIFWTPYNIVIFLTFLQHLGYMASPEWYDTNLKMAMRWVETLAFSHCCLNPIIYAFVGQKFRNLFLKILKEWFPCCFGQCTTIESEFSERRTYNRSRWSVISSTKEKSKEYDS